MTTAALPVTFMTDRLVIGGAERHAITVANALDRARFEVSFLTLKPEGRLESLLDQASLAHFATAGVARKLDIDAVGRITDQLRTSRCRVVVAANPYSTLYAMLAAMRLKPRPVIVSTFHSTVMSELKDQLQMVFYRAVYPFCDVLVYVCENQRRYWRRRGLRARSDTMIYNGIDTTHFSAGAVAAAIPAVRQSLGLDGSEFVVGICAALRPEKAHVDLLNAVAMLRRDGIAVRCMMIGDGPERERLEALASVLGIADRTAITGYQMDVRPFVLACDAMTLTSHSETFSLSALESMALGKPMIMTRTGGAAEQVAHGSTGLLYEPGDVPQLARHLKALVESGDAARMGTLAAESVRAAFPAAKMVAEYSELIATAGRRRAVR